MSTGRAITQFCGVCKKHKPLKEFKGGNMLYCRDCRNVAELTRPKKSKKRQGPKPKKKAKAATTRLDADGFPTTSVRTVSGGLPGLGRRR